MITVLVVAEAGRARELDQAAARMPSLELLHAGDVEQALDRLARNRRIDAVLLIGGRDFASEVARVILEEDPGAPPLYVPAGDAPIQGTHLLEGQDPANLLDTLAGMLSAE